MSCHSVTSYSAGYCRKSALTFLVLAMHALLGHRGHEIMIHEVNVGRAFILLIEPQMN